MVTPFKQQTLPIQIWDNGFAFSALDKTFAKKIKLTPLQNKINNDVKDGNGVEMPIQYEPGHVEIGKVIISGSPFTIIDFKTMMGNNAKLILKNNEKKTD